MSEIKKDRPKKEKKRLSRSALVLIAGILIIAIPVIIFLSILGISALHSGTPREGSRFDNDLDPKITDAQVKELKADLETLGSLDSVEVVLSQGQLRIFIDTNDSLTEQQIDTMLTNAYNKVNSKLPISTYFTATDTKKMYDLQINIYTTPEASEIAATNSRQYKLLHKNSAEDQYGIDDMAHPKNEQLAAELEGRVEKPTNNEIGTAGDGSEEIDETQTETETETE
ncbi:MAG: hypothetical protein IJI92_02005 [Erysipelotrichaceae bacterium]|nr:hypothetical protein [Erysipelotrichaceae bacterium]